MVWYGQHNRYGQHNMVWYGMVWYGWQWRMARLTMNAEFCEDNSVTSKKTRYCRKNKVRVRPPGPSPGSAAGWYGTILHNYVGLSHLQKIPN